MFPKPYDIDQLLTDSPVDRAMREPVPDFVESGGDGVSPKYLGSGDLGGNMTVQDGYLQSSNYVAGTTGWRLTPTGGDFNFSIQADEVHVPDVDTTANSFHVEADGDTWWGTTQTLWTADNENALAYVLKTGVAKFKSITLSGTVAISGIANNTSTDIMLLEKTHNLVFSVTDSNTIAWTSGTVTLSNGRTFSISSGNTGNMAALTYIYIDPAVSSTVLQTTTTYSTAVGANKILIGTAQNNTVTASYIPYGPGQPLVDGAQIGALSIVAGNIAASAITATKINVSQLSAISADMGSITAGTIVLASGGYLRSGQTAYDTGTGWWIGNDSGTPKFSIGSTTKSMKWDGSSLVASNMDIIRTFTAGEDISAEKPVGINLKGKIAKANRAWAEDATSIPTNIDTIVDVIALTTNKYVVLFSRQGVYPEHFSAVVTIDNDSNNITFGTKVTHTTSGRYQSGAAICKLSTSKYVVLWCADAENDAEYQVCTVSGSTITVQETGELGTGTWTRASCCFVDTDKFAFVFYNEGNTTCFHGFCTVSTYTPTVVSSSTAIITSMITSSVNLLMMTKIATDKVAMFNVENGWGAVATTDSSTWTVGGAANIYTTSGGNVHTGDIVSAATDTFWIRNKGGAAYCTVSTRTISVGATLAVRTGPVDLIIDGTTVWEIFNDDSDSTYDGIYKLTVSGSVISRSFIMPFPITGGSTMRGESDGTFFIVIGDGGDYHVQGMASNFIGFNTSAADQDVSVPVQISGVIDLGGSMTPGVPLYVTANSSSGTLTEVPTTVEAGIPISATELLIKSY